MYHFAHELFLIQESPTKNETKTRLEKNTVNQTRDELYEEGLKAFEEWKDELESGRKKERTPQTALDWGTRPGEVYRFGEPAWSREDYNKSLYSTDKNETDF